MRVGYIYAIPLIVLLYLLIGPMFAPEKASLWAIIALIVVSMFNKECRIHVSKFVSACEQTVKGMIMIASACAAVGLLMGAISLTGLGPILARALLDVTGGELWLLLPFTAVVCYIVGMGMGTLPIYLILATLVAPVLVEAGIPELAAHLFILWFGLTTFITPPVCLNAYAAASISGGSAMRTAFEAMRLGSASYIVPFAFVVGPSLLLMGSTYEIITSVISAIIGIAALASGLQGWLFGRLSWLLRIPLVGAAVVLIFPGWMMDLIGLSIVAAASLINLWQVKAEQIKHAQQETVT